MRRLHPLITWISRVFRGFRAAEQGARLSPIVCASVFSAPLRGVLERSREARAPGELTGWPNSNPAALGRREGARPKNGKTREEASFRRPVLRR
jgi:hypothetical protein